MVIFGIVTEENKIVTNLMTDILVKLSSVNPIKNPFKSRLVFCGKAKYIFYLLPLYFNYSIMGWVGALGLWLIAGWTNWIIPFLVVGSMGIFWTKYFYMLMLTISLRKKGYKGSINYVNAEYIITEWLL